MRIVDRKFVDNNTLPELFKLSGLLGKRSQVVRMYPRLTISNLTEGLKRVH
jgi:hypothetical protein